MNPILTQVVILTVCFVIFYYAGYAVGRRERK